MNKAYVISKKELANIVLEHITATIAPELNNKIIDATITFKEDCSEVIVEIKHTKPVPINKEK